MGVVGWNSLEARPLFHVKQRTMRFQGWRGHSTVKTTVPAGDHDMGEQGRGARQRPRRRGRTAKIFSFARSRPRQGQELARCEPHRVALPDAVSWMSSVCWNGRHWAGLPGSGRLVGRRLVVRSHGKLGGKAQPQDVPRGTAVAAGAATWARAGSGAG